MFEGHTHRLYLLAKPLTFSPSLSYRLNTSQRYLSVDCRNTDTHADAHVHAQAHTQGEPELFFISSSSKSRDACPYNQDQVREYTSAQGKSHASLTSADGKAKGRMLLRAEACTHVLWLVSNSAWILLLGMVCE